MSNRPWSLTADTELEETRAKEKEDLSQSIIIQSLSVPTGSNPVLDRPEARGRFEASEDSDAEFMLPDLPSLVIVILSSALSQISFFIVIAAASAYATHLGGTATFSGLTIGIPAIFASLALIPMAHLDKGRYKTPFHISYATMVLGNVLYALAYRANYLHLILIGRIISGVGFSSLMYSKRYLSDPRLVGIRRRTTLASWLVVGQGFGFSAGPFLGGLLFKIGFANSVFNGFTSPGWIMAGVWTMFGASSIALFSDISPQVPRASNTESHRMTHLHDARTSPPPNGNNVEVSEIVEVDAEQSIISRRQWGVIITMMWHAMTCFFILGAWESNIPVYTADLFHYTPYNAGNFVALGGITAFPFLLINVWYSKKTQDRVILAIGSSLGLAGILIMLATVSAGSVTFGSFYVCWVLVALGFNLASTCTLSLLSKQLPATWNGRISLAIQYSNNTGRVLGAVWGGAGVKVGMGKYLALQISIVGIGILMYSTLWRELKAKTG